jgi:rifampicin phosphotransferase
LAKNYRHLISIRQTKYKTFEKEVRSNRYQLIGDSRTPVPISLVKNIEGNIKGIGCCSGVVTNKVVLITPESIKQNNFAGCILVAKYFEPGWINIFGQAAGVISEKGNLLSHTAILCREMGIPAIVGAKGITGIVKNGDIITMNGGTGEIKTKTHGE